MTAIPPHIGVTGASGMIGSCLIHAILEQNPHAAVRCMVRHAPLQPHPSQIRYFEADLLSEADCREFVKGLDVIVHLAQSNSPAASDRHWPSDCAANLQTTLNLLDAIRSSGRKCHLVFASSGGAIYGHHPDVDFYHENLDCKPLSPYGIQKLAAEHYLRLGVAQEWLSVCALRISNAYGALLPPERKQGLIGVAVARHRACQPVDIFGNAATVRDYVHIQDIASAFIAAMGFPEIGFSSVNISSGIGHSVAEILAVISEVSGKQVEVQECEFGSQQFALTPRMILSNEKARTCLGWQPHVQLHEGIQRLWSASKQAQI